MLYVILLLQLVAITLLSLQLYSRTPSGGLPSQTTYTVKTDGTNYWAVKDDGTLSYQGTDSATVIQNSIDSLPPQGGTIKIDAGLYTETKKVTISRSSVTIIGDSYAGTADNASGTHFSLANGVNDDMFLIRGWYFTLVGVTLEGNGANQKAGVGVLNLQGYDFTIERVSIFHGHGNGIFIQAVSANGGILIQDYSELNSGYGLRIEAGSTGSTGNGEIDVVKSDFFGNMLGGALIYGNVQRTLWQDVRFERNTYGGAVGLRIRNHGQNVPKYNHFIGSWFYLNAQVGISLEGAQYNTFVGNDVRSNGQEANNTYDGVIFRNGETSTPSLHNTFTATMDTNDQTNLQRYAFEENDSYQDYNQILGGEVSGDGTGEIRLQGPHSIAQNVVGFNPQPPSVITAGASVWIYTNNDHYPEFMVLTSVGGVSGFTCNSATEPLNAGTTCYLSPNQMLDVAWSITPPVFEKQPT